MPGNPASRLPDVVKFPVTFSDPLTTIPVGVTVNTVSTPPTPTVTLPFVVVIATLLVPFAILVGSTF